jgi:hypothetical protein
LVTASVDRLGESSDRDQEIQQAGLHGNLRVACKTEQERLQGEGRGVRRSLLQLLFPVKEVGGFFLLALVFVRGLAVRAIIPSANSAGLCLRSTRA